jgi:hypothetical protein
MKTTRTTKIVLLAAVTMALFGWLASEFTSPPKARAQRINTKHNIVTTPIAAPASASAQPAAAPSVQGQR